jgi:alpha-L-fucosidase 2
MQWKDARLVKLVVKSTLGGNLRLRVPNEIQKNKGARLHVAAGKNPNLFYRMEEIPAPVISPKAKVELLELKKSHQYDLPTKKGRIYTLVGKG